jgi:Ca2+-binding RTX toxin-like protein
MNIRAYQRRARVASSSGLETLESRRLMSAAVESGVLRIFGADDRNDAIVLTRSGSNIVVTRNGVNEGQFELTSVSSIRAVLGAGNDSFDSSTVSKPTFVAGDAGNDRIVTGASYDKLQGGADKDTLIAGDGPDSLDGGSGDDALDGQSGNDTLTGGTGKDNLIGSAGFDWADYRNHGSAVRVTLDGETNDGSSGENDYVGASMEAVLGTRFDDILVGSSGNNILRGYAGRDILNGEGGNDILEGGDGDDAIVGGPGNDELIGGAGRDGLAGGADYDTVDYRQSASTVRITQDGKANDGSNNGSECDNIYADIEILFGSRFDDRFVGGNGHNQFHGGDGNDYADGGGGTDFLYGENGNDTLIGNAGNDILRGGNHDDNLYGGAGKDELFGDAGHDGLFGGRGSEADSLTGGSGMDRFLDNLYVDWNTLGWKRTDKALDYAALVDARLDLYDTYRTYNVNHSHNNYPARTSFGEGKWTDAEVQSVDASMGVMHRAAGGNTMILRRGGVFDTNLWRLGPIIGGDVVPAKAWYAGYTGLYFGNDAMTSDSNIRISTLVAFAKQQWQSLSSSKQSAWRSLSDWRNDDAVKSNSFYTSYMGSWFHLKSAKFVSNEARLNPAEDFAQTWAAVIYQRAGWNNPFTQVLAKEQFVNGIVNALRP